MGLCVEEQQETLMESKSLISMEFEARRLSLLSSFKNKACMTKKPEAATSPQEKILLKMVMLSTETGISSERA